MHSLSSQHLDLVPLQQPFQWVRGPDGSKIPEDIRLNWTYDLSRSTRLPGSHGEEIVRDVFSDAHVSSPSHFLILVVIWLLTPCRAVPHSHVEKMVRFELGSSHKPKKWMLSQRKGPILKDIRCLSNFSYGRPLRRREQRGLNQSQPQRGRRKRSSDTILIRTTM